MVAYLLAVDREKRAFVPQEGHGNHPGHLRPRTEPLYRDMLKHYGAVALRCRLRCLRGCSIAVLRLRRIMVVIDLAHRTGVAGGRYMPRQIGTCRVKRGHVE
jgi:hypothetical protein